MQPFESDAVAVLASAREAFAVLIASLPSPIRKPTDLKRCLRIDPKLAWQVFRVATATDPLSAGLHVPGAAALKGLLRAASRNRVPSPVIDSVKSAAQEFESLVKRHAGDRSSFVSMISSHAATGSEQIDREHRRAAFRANSHIWGVQAQTKLSCSIIQASEEENRVDIAYIRGFVGLRRFRRDAPQIVSRMVVADDDGKVRQGIAREPIDPDGQVQPGTSLLKDFCTQPLPELRAFEMNGMLFGELVGGDVGSRSAVTCITGDVSRSAGPVHRDEDNKADISFVVVRTPCEVLVHDLLVEVGLFGEIAPHAAVYSDHQGNQLREFNERERLPMQVSAEPLGCGPSVLRTPDVPRYAEMMRYVFERLRRDADRFEVYRCRVEYPVMPSSVVIKFDLPPRRTR